MVDYGMSHTPLHRRSCVFDHWDHTGDSQDCQACRGSWLLHQFCRTSSLQLFLSRLALWIDSQDRRFCPTSHMSVHMLLETQLVHEDQETPSFLFLQLVLDIPELLEVPLDPCHLSALVLLFLLSLLSLLLVPDLHVVPTSQLGLSLLSVPSLPSLPAVHWLPFVPELQ